MAAGVRLVEDAVELWEAFEAGLTGRDLAHSVAWSWAGLDYPLLRLQPERWVQMWRAAGFLHGGRPATRPSGSVKVYRGAEPEWSRGMSWAPTRSLAEIFVDRSRRIGRDARLYAATVAPDELLGSVSLGGRLEYVVDLAPDTAVREVRSVLFVCAGNICRSPAAEVMLRARLDAAGMDHIDVASVGVSVRTGEAMDPGTAADLIERGIADPSHSARPLRYDDLARADIVVVLEASAERYMRAMVAASRLVRDVRIVPVPNPWRGQPAAYRNAGDQIEAVVEGLAAELAS